MGPGTHFKSFMSNRFAGLSDETPSSSASQDDQYSNNSSSNKYDNYNNRGGNNNMQRQNSRENSRQRNEFNGPSRSFQASNVQRQSSSSGRDAGATIHPGGTHSQIITRRSQQAEVEPVFNEKDEPTEAELNKIRNLLKTLIKEFIVNKSLEDFVLDFKRDINRKYRWVAIREMFSLALELKEDAREAVAKLCLHSLRCKDNTLLTVPEYRAAAKHFFGKIPDEDYPHIMKYTALYFGDAIDANFITFKDIYDYSMDLIEFCSGDKLLVALFTYLVSKVGSIRVRELWQASGLQIGQFLGKEIPDQNEVSDFISKNVSIRLMKLRKSIVYVIFLFFIFYRS